MVEHLPRAAETLASVHSTNEKEDNQPVMRQPFMYISMVPVERPAERLSHQSLTMMWDHWNSHITGVCINLTAKLENSWQFHIRLKIYFPGLWVLLSGSDCLTRVKPWVWFPVQQGYSLFGDPAVLLLSIYSEEMQWHP